MESLTPSPMLRESSREAREREDRPEWAPPQAQHQDAHHCSLCASHHFEFWQGVSW